MTLDLKSYTLGIFEGEGTIFATRNRGCRGETIWGVAVSIMMIDPEPVELLRQVWGGKQVTTRPGNRFPLYEWKLWKKADILPFVEYVAKYGKVKQQQAAWAIMLLSAVQDRGVRTKGVSRGSCHVTKEQKLLRERCALAIRSLNRGKDNWEIVGTQRPELPT